MDGKNTENSDKIVEKPNQDTDKIIKRGIEDEMKESYLDYSMSVIVGRALPDIRDGLKPVHRRILFSMNGMGMFHNKPFKKSARIVGECFVKGTLISTPKGLIPIEQLKVNDIVYTQTNEKKITRLYEMPKQALLDIKLENSLKNTSTKGQMFKVFTKDFSFEWKRADHLKPGDYLVLRNIFPDIQKNVSLTKGKELNSDLAYLIGFFMSDGWIEKSTNRIGFFSISKEIIERVRHIIKKEFNYSSAISIKKNDGSKTGYIFRISKSAITDFFIKNFGIKSLDAISKNIPSHIFKSPKKVVYSFLSGLFDGDGSIHLNRNCIHYGSVSENLIQNLQILLHSLDISSNIYVSFLSEHTLNGRIIKANYPFFALEINSTNCMTLAKNLTLANKSKSVRLSRLNNSIKKKTYFSNIPFASKHIFSEFTRNHIGGGWFKDKNGKKFRDGIRYNDRCKIRYSKNLHDMCLGKEQIIKLSILKKLKKIDSPLYNKLQSIIDNNIQFLKIIEISDGGEDITFDIQVKDDHEFIANGMIVHNCLGKYHPHGDSAVYDALVRMAQSFSLRYPLVQGHGNFGSVDGDSAAAQRYTEARMSKLAEQMLEDLDKNTVKFVPNFDDSLKEPSVLPSKVPNLLVNGSSGIAVGMATNIPPHNMKEVCEGVIQVIDNPDITVDNLMNYVKGPDFPTGGLIQGANGIRNAYKTGRGKLIVKAKYKIEDLKKDKKQIVFTEIPYQVNKSMLVEEIARLVKDKKAVGITDLRDESDRSGMRIVVELSAAANQEVILNQLYKHSRLQVTFGIILLSLVDNQPRVLNLLQIINEFIKHRRIVVRKRTEFDLKKAEEKAHILEGLIIALNNIDDVIPLIKKSKTVEEARNGLMSNFSLTKIQAQAILDMRLQRLTSLEQDKIKEEHKSLLQLIEKLKAILADESKILGIIKTELREVQENFGDERKTEISKEESSFIEEQDLIESEDMVVTISNLGYIKRTPLSLYKQQKRGGKGVKAAATKEEDFISDLFIANTHDHMLFFTEKGIVHWKKVYELPLGARQAKGTPIVNLLELKEKQRITSCMPITEFKSDLNLIMATKKGIIKKTTLDKYSNPRKGGIIAIVLDKDDELVDVDITDGSQDILIATKKGMAIRFNEKDCRPIGRASRGVKGITLRSDKVVNMMICHDDESILTVTENGYGKRTKLSEYRVIGRGGVGVINIQCDERNGSVVSVKSVKDEDELMFISRNGITIRVEADNISTIGRNTKGVRIMRMSESDKVVKAAKIAKENGDNGEEGKPDDISPDNDSSGNPKNPENPENPVDEGEQHPRLASNQPELEPDVNRTAVDQIDQKENSGQKSKNGMVGLLKKTINFLK